MNTTPEALPKTKRRVRIKLRKKIVSIRLDPAIHQRADKFANEDNRSFSQYVELLLEQHIKERDRQEQQAIQEQQELAGSMRPGEVHGVWSAYDEFKAAAQLHALLEHSQA